MGSGLQRLATFNSLSVQMRLEERSRMESKIIVCYLGGIWGQLDLSGRFAGVPSLGKPLRERERAVYGTTHKTAINQPMDYTGET